MKKFVEKLIGRLEERKNLWALRGSEFSFAGGTTITDERAFGTSCGLYEAIEIVKQLAEEYNDGWIPCSERLPDFPKKYEEEKYYLTTIRKNNGEVFMETLIFHNYGWYIPRNYEVIAWKETEPYKKGD